jgi:DNA-binding protein HU-beta
MAGKADIILDVRNALNITNNSATAVVETVLASISARLANKEDVAFRGFGSFKVKKRPARAGRNPATGAVIEIPEREVITFKAAK